MAGPTATLDDRVCRHSCTVDGVVFRHLARAVLSRRALYVRLRVVRHDSSNSNNNSNTLPNIMAASLDLSRRFGPPHTLLPRQ